MLTVYVIKRCSSFGKDANEGVQSFNFEAGQKFKSFKEFESQLKHYQDAKCIQMYRRSSCNIESTKTKQTITNNDLIFSELKYTCVHGGRNCVSNSKGSRPNQR